MKILLYDVLEKRVQANITSGAHQISLVTDCQLSLANQTCRVLSCLRAQDATRMPFRLNNALIISSPAIEMGLSPLPHSMSLILLFLLRQITKRMNKRGCLKLFFFESHVQ